jgi:hypothetical protein
MSTDQDEWPNFCLVRKNERGVGLSSVFSVLVRGQNISSFALARPRALHFAAEIAHARPEQGFV